MRSGTHIPTHDEMCMGGIEVRWLRNAYASSAILAVILLVGCSNQHVGSNIYRIGCITPLTGSYANYGRSAQRGIELALDSKNEELKAQGARFKIVYEDDRMAAKDGTAAAEKLISADKVPIIIGPFGSTVVLAVSPIAERNKTVVISASATADKIADAGDYVFRIVPSNRRQAKDCAEFCSKKLGKTAASILYMNSDYGVTLRDGFNTSFKALGGKILSTESFNPGATDFRAQLARIKTMQPEVVFFPGLYQETALILKQARELGVKAVFIGGDGSCTDDMLKLAGNAAEGTYYANMAMDYASANPAVRQFVSHYKRKYGQEPDVYSAYYFDCFNIVANAVLKGGYSANRIRDYFYTMPVYKGITGDTKFDRRGEVDKPFYIFRVENGKFHLVNR